MARLEAAAAAVVLAVLALGLALLPLQLPWFTEMLSARYSQMPPAQALPLSEAARAFVVGGDAGARGALEAAMTPDAVTHLDDVRRVIRGANAATLALTALVATWVALSLARRRASAVAAGFSAGSVLTAALVVLAGLVAVTDFDAFFSAFHGLFFAPGTWTFPSDSVLIRLFPEAFWTTAGIAWGVVTLLVAGVYAAVAALLRRNHTANASR